MNERKSCQASTEQLKKAAKELATKRRAENGCPCLYRFLVCVTFVMPILHVGCSGDEGEGTLAFPFALAVVVVVPGPGHRERRVLLQKAIN